MNELISIQEKRSYLLDKRIINSRNQVIKKKFKYLFGEEFFVDGFKGLTSYDFQRVSINGNGSVKVSLTPEMQKKKDGIIADISAKYKSERVKDIVDFKTNEAVWSEFFNYDQFISNLYNRLYLYRNVNNLNKFLLQQAIKIKPCSGYKVKNKLYQRAYMIYFRITVEMIKGFVLSECKGLKEKTIEKYISETIKDNYKTKINKKEVVFDRLILLLSFNNEKELKNTLK